MEPPASPAPAVSAAPAAPENDRSRARLVAFVHPLAAAIVLLCACLIAWRPGAVAAPDLDHLLRLFPFDNRWDARIGAGVTALAALLVTVFAGGKAGRRLRRTLGVLGLAVIVAGAYCTVRTIRNDCHRWEGCDFWHVPSFFIAAVLLLLASMALLVWAGHAPGTRLRWFGASAVVALAIASAAWTYRATRTRQRYSGAQLAGIHLQGYFESNNPFVPAIAPEGAPAEPADPDGRIPPAVPALPVQGETLVCAGDWRVVKFPDKDRCLPRRPMVTIDPADVEEVTVVSPSAGGPPEVVFRLTSDAGRRFATALRTAKNFHFVLITARGDLIMDNWFPESIPGPFFGIKPGRSGATETERILRLVLDWR